MTFVATGDGVYEMQLPHSSARRGRRHHHLVISAC